MPVDWILAAKVLMLVAVANGTPLGLRRLLGETASWPIDFGLLLPDGGPLLGASKTIRGFIGAIVATCIAAPAIGLPWEAGLLAGGGAMMGDLLSSFTKRRLGYAPSSMATGIDQIPESLLGAWAASLALPLGPFDIMLVTATFFVGQQIMSWLFFRMHWRDEPY